MRGKMGLSDIIRGWDEDVQRLYTRVGRRIPEQAREEACSAACGDRN